MRTSLLAAIIMVLTPGALSLCRDSYVTFCDDFSDLQHRQLNNITELVIGAEDNHESKLKDINYDSVPLDSFLKLKGLTILGSVKAIEVNTFLIDPVDLSLDYLKLHGNKIQRLKAYTFDSIKVRRFSFTGNQLEYIHKEAFANCDFETIDLSNNKLELLEQETLSDEVLAPVSLQELIVKFNTLERIEPGTFATSLRILNLDYNKLKHLNYDVFKDLMKLEELTLSYNQLTSLPDLRNLTGLITLDVSHNKLISIRFQNFNCFKNLLILNFNHNNLFNANAFDNFKFHGRADLLQVSLAYNRFTHLNVTSPMNGFKDVRVVLFGNPWNCACWQKLETFMDEQRTKRNKCDMKYFGNGNLPFCIQYKDNDCVSTNYKKNPDFTEADLNRFLSLIDDSLEKDNLNCTLTPEKV